MAKSARQAGRRPIGRRTGAAARRVFWGMCAAAALACGLALVHVWIRVESYERSLRRGAASTENRELAAERQRLEVEVGRLKSATTVRREATEALGMAPPVEVIVIPRERTAEKVREARQAAERMATSPGGTKATKTARRKGPGGLRGTLAGVP